MSKIEPAVQTVGLVITAPPGASTNYCDLSQIASLINRRFYRQGINWAVAGFKVFNVNGIAGGITISKLPNTWVMSNAWEKGMRSWTRMIREATEEAPSIRPRFLDFKIYADDQHHVAGVGSNLLPSGSLGLATPGEWDYSTYEIPISNADPTLPAGNSVTRDVIATGPNYAGAGASGNFAVSLIEGYASGRALPDIEAPNMPEDASSAQGSLAQNWQVALFNDGTEQDSEVIQDLETQNNRAPYPFENDGVNLDTMYPGGANQLTGLQYHDAEYFTSTTISNIVRLKGGNFPCGLIRFDTQNAAVEPAIFSVVIDLIPGSHRGYLCEPMTEM